MVLGIVLEFWSSVSIRKQAGGLEIKLRGKVITRIGVEQFLLLLVEFLTILDAVLFFVTIKLGTIELCS